MLLDDEEGGCFFGGGIIVQELEILDFVDGVDVEVLVLDKIDVGWFCKIVFNFEKYIIKNVELCVKFED